MRKLSLFEPNISKLDKKMVLQSMNKNQISTHGSYTGIFEKEVKKITRSKYNLATSSGSSALFVALKSIGVKKNDIVLTQSYTFAATTNAIILNNSTPLLLDISLDNLNLNLNQLKNFLEKKTYKKNNYTFHKKSKKKISCICLVFTLGIIPDLEKFKAISRKYRLKIIFDAACALGHKYKKQKLTKYCDAAIYSFNGNKNFTTAAGGLISTENKKYYDFAKKFSNNGKIINAYDYKMIGFNLKMSSINAAIGLAQIKRFKEIQINKKKINQYYNQNLTNIKLFKCEFSWGKYMAWMNFSIIKNQNKRKKIIQRLRKKNILANNFWLPMHKQPVKNNFFLTDFPNSNYLHKRILVLPSSTNMNLNIVKKISKIINEIKL
jgi:dTDP-4-amino-4,6-dideoxygalactose transaminase